MGEEDIQSPLLLLIPAHPHEKNSRVDEDTTETISLSVDLVELLGPHEYRLNV